MSSPYLQLLTIICPPPKSHGDNLGVTYASILPVATYTISNAAQPYDLVPLAFLTSAIILSILSNGLSVSHIAFKATIPCSTVPFSNGGIDISLQKLQIP